MQKIINITDDIIFIGNEDGGISEVRLSDCTFTPAIGDDVKVFSSETKCIVSKIEKETPVVLPVVEQPQDRINISVINKNNTIEPQENGFYPATPITQRKVVKKSTYCWLAFLLGGIGAHKFYEGKVFWGIVYLLFCITGIPAIVAIIELIVTLFKPADVNGNIVV